MKQHTPNASPLNLTFALTWGLILVTMGLTACDKPGPAQEAGRHIDEAAEQASRTVQQKLTQAKVMNQSDIKQVDAAVSDADITAKVKLALMMRDGLNSLTISVKTQAGVVTLTGSVSDAAQFRLAQDLARSVDDVSQVENNLSIVSATK